MAISKKKDTEHIKNNLQLELLYKYIFYIMYI